MSTLLRVTTPTACGGMVIEDGVVTLTAPFLDEFRGQRVPDVREECEGFGWKVETVSSDHAAKRFVHRLEGLLWPERFPPGHPRHDPDHVFWASGGDGASEVYGWSADTIEWVSELVTEELEKVRAPEPEPSRAMHPRHAWESHRIQLEGQDEPLLLWQCSDCGATRWKGREDNEKASAPCEGEPC